VARRVRLRPAGLLWASPLRKQIISSFAATSALRPTRPESACARRSRPQRTGRAGARSGFPFARRIPAHRRACGSAFCRAPPVSGTIRRSGFLRRNAGWPASDRHCGRDRSCLCFPPGVHGILLLCATIRHRDHPGILNRWRRAVRDDHARMLRDIADDGVAAIPGCVTTVLRARRRRPWFDRLRRLPLPCRGLELCSRRCLLKDTRMASARGSATREAIIRRSEPVQLQLWVRILPAIAPKSPLSGRPRGVLQMARWWNRALDLPVKMFSQAGSKHPCQRHLATLHGVVFDILVGSENRVGAAVPVPQPGAVGDPMICRTSRDPPGDPRQARRARPGRRLQTGQSEPKKRHPLYLIE
jgi:hypothetical protein